MKKIKLSKTGRISRGGEFSYISTGTNQYAVNQEEYYKILDILSFLKEERTETEFNEYVRKNNIDDSFIEQLRKANMVTKNPLLFEKSETIQFKNDLYLDVMFDNSYEISKTISEYTFIIVGVGGIGNYISYALQSFSPKKLILIDGDTIELGNLNRQFLFNLADVGSFKTKVLERELKKRNSEIHIQTIEKYCDSSLLEEVAKTLDIQKSMIILSGDSASILEDVTRISMQYNIPFLNVGYLNDISVIGPFVIPGVSSCPFCFNAYSVEDEEQATDVDSAYTLLYNDIDAQSTAPSAFVNNAIASSMAIVDVLGYVSGDYSRINSLDKRLGLSNRDFERLEIVNTQDTNCNYCAIARGVE
ncbi:TPA: ThiF family adenylyltransferase [Streptococcus suis]